ncbi:GDSL-type esterase/lipase family protein [Synoicihabitans lomoniglobus]|uniref:GDSL-type esterase/lipase family protein n=1 Tax=Synoicihabitans lomoniglobus TaxID=2909285 RepID=A0AAE9ZRZ5_9BACT|nr:GDSL-type esterase/lipase family protein [Opitutaceae bacterium LMO-M01]WED63151.1 GDSL-type esterase/lipase family protein [Opitutaceae bacterium LMO-M01]
MMLNISRFSRLSVWLCGWLAAGALHAASDPVLVTVQPERRFQTIEGFGTSITGWIARHHDYFRDPAFADYAVNELGLSIFRLQLKGDVMPEAVADWREISHENFNWTHADGRGGVNVGWARLITAANPEVRVIGAVWSPPGWMKVSGKVDGTAAGYLFDPDRDFDHDNRLRADRYEHFAKWIVEYARYMEAQGTPFYALSLQNELVFTEPYGSTMYDPTEYARLVRVTGEMFARERVRQPLFFGPEDMTLATYADEDRHRPYVDALMAPAVAPYFDAFATHGYSDGVNADTRLNMVAYERLVAHFGRPYWITEGASGGHEWPDVMEGGLASRLHVALARANVSLFTGWQLTGDGRHPTHAFMLDRQPTKKTYAAMQFWRHIRPGATRVGMVDPSADDLLVSSYVHDRRGELVSILINTGEAPREVLLNWGRSAHPTTWQAWQTTAQLDHALVDVEPVQQMVRLQLPARSITTAVADWDPEWVEPRRKPRWNREIKQIVEREAAHPVPENGILFVGSSSIRLWESLAQDFPNHPVYNRGFGGSQVSDLIGFFDEVIAAGNPRQIIIYSGTNDVNAGESPESVMADFDALCGMIRAALPDTQIALIGAAPNPHRWPVQADYVRFNAMARHYCEREGHTYVDVWTPMLGEDGLPSRDLYRDDQLHMNAAGYAIWREIMAPLLK